MEELFRKLKSYSMLNRVVMYVVRMMFKIIFIPDQMFPKSGLEDTMLAFVNPTL